MCVAVVIESKKRIPAQHLKAMHDANPHGAGVAWIDGDLIQYRKGLTWKQIDDIQDLLPRPFFMHFRIATRGAKIPELTHPFPLGLMAFSDDLVGSAHGVLMHNGTWSGYRQHVPNGINPEVVSDTQVAAYACDEDENILSEVSWSNAIMRAKGNGRADITLRGRWFEFEGNQYSNTHWKTELERPMWSHNQNWGEYYSKYPRTKTKPMKTHQGKGRKKGTPVATTPVATTPATSANENKAPSSGTAPGKYEQAMINYGKDVDRGRAFAGARTTDEETAYKAWGNERFADGFDAPAKKEVKCPDCNQEIRIIPCPCQDVRYECDVCLSEDTEHVTGDHWICNQCWTSFYVDSKPHPDDLIDARELPGELETMTEAQLDALDLLEAKESCALGGEVVGDVEDLNAYGMGAGLDAFPEDLCLSGDKQEDWKKVDDWIRANGIKI